MERRNRINNFYHFLEDNKENESNINAILSRFKGEIQSELEYDKNLLSNYYLNNLLLIKDGQMEAYIYAKMNGTDEEIQSEFETFMDFLIQDVSLHGLGVAQ